MDEKDRKVVKTFKDKLKDRVSLVKQKSTELLLNTKSHTSARHECRDVQTFVDSLLPEVHQEIEIEQALNAYIAETNTKETSQQIKERRKIEEDFFISVVSENEQVKTKKSKNKTNNTDGKNSKTNSPYNALNNKSPMKIASEYFDLEINKPELITASIINKVDYQNEAKDLFWNGTTRPVEINTRQTNFAADGLAVGNKPQIKSSHLKAILSHSNDSSDWFNENGDLMTLDYPIRDFDNEDIRFITTNKIEIFSRHVDPEIVTQNNKNNMTLNQATTTHNAILEINLISLKFYHHSLFSLEHILASKLERYYETYMQKISENTSLKLNQQLDMLRKNLDRERQILFKENNNNYKKIYKNENFQKKTKEITSVRKLRMDEALIERELERNILKAWRCIKYVRRQLKFTCTDVVLQINKKKTNLLDEQTLWETMFDQEVSNTLDQIKCEYFEKKNQFNKQKNESESFAKLKRPILNYDEDKIRRKTFNEMCEAFRQPGDPIISFKLSHSAEIITETPEHTNEVNRRNDVEKTKIFVKISLNNKDVCKTKSHQLNQDFTVQVNSSFLIRIPENTESIDLLIMEHSSLLPANVIGRIELNIPDKSLRISKTKIDRRSFELKQIRNNNHFGAGNSGTITEMLNKKLGEFKLGHLDIDNTLDAKCSLQLNVGWVQDSNNSLTPFTNVHTNKKMLVHQKPTKEMLTKLFDNVLDPNDPKHTFLYTFMNNFQGKNICTDNFYLNDTFNFNFTMNRRSNDGDFVIQNEKNENDSVSQLVPYDVVSISGRVSRTPRESVLDNISFANRVLDPIDLHRRMSIRYLELVNEHLMMQNDREKEKQLSDILTFVEYHRIRNIRMDFLRPRQPLFHPSHSKQSSVSIKTSMERGKEYSLKVCILKAFQLPCRTEGNNADDNGGLKMISLRPFIRVSCQGINLRTSTAVGNNPTWNQQLFFTVKNDQSSEINIHLFDEQFEDLLEDDRLENSTVHCQYSANWLASLKVPLISVVTQPKMEGIFLMYSPPDILGYKQSTEERYSTMSDGLRKEVNVKQKGGFYISLLLETFPNYANESQIPQEFLESNEMEYMIRYLNTFADTYKNQHPTRKINLLVLDTSGKYVCITRFFKALPLPDFAECIRSFNNVTMTNVEESEHSSKSSTPNKRKKSHNAEEVTSQSIKSLLSGGDTGRQSKTTRETFELRSLNNEAGDDSEKGLALKVNACVRFVSMIPLFQQTDTSQHCIALTGYQTLRLTCGSVLDHTTLLMSYLLQLDVECWCVSGHSLLRGYSSYVLVRERQNPNQTDYKNGKVSLSRNKNVNWKYFIYDAVIGVKYDTKDPFCPLQKVYSVCNNENIWVNVQPVERCSLVRFNLKEMSDWRPVFQKQLMACPGPLPGIPIDEVLYSHSTQDVARLRDAIEDKIKVKIQRWRGHRRTIWNRHCSSILRKSLISWEKWCLNPSSARPKISQKLQQLMMSYQMYGFPYNVTYTTMRDIISCVKSTQIHLDEHSHTEYALAVDVFPYPNRIYSVWIYICTLIKKADTQ